MVILPLAKASYCIAHRKQHFRMRSNWCVPFLLLSYSFYAPSRSLTDIHVVTASVSDFPASKDLPNILGVSMPLANEQRSDVFEKELGIQRATGKTTPGPRHKSGSSLRGLNLGSELDGDVRMP